MRISKKRSYRAVLQPVLFVLTLLVIGLITLLVPLEQTLGANMRLVYLHGAWVWTGIIAFGLSALIGLAAFLTRRAKMHVLSLALARTGLFFWLTYLPMSLLVMQLNWGGLALDEPRWVVPFRFGVVAVALQIGLLLIDRPRLTSAANFLFGTALICSLAATQNILHPDSPVFSSDSTRIQLFFMVLLVLVLAAGGQMCWWGYQRICAGIVKK